MDLADFKRDYDWREVLGYGGKDQTYAERVPPPAAVGENPPTAEPFGMDDIADIIAADPGENDGPSWLCVLKLVDERYAYIEAGCGYTGWDCCGGGSAWVASDLPNLIVWGLTNPARQRLGMPLLSKMSASEHAKASLAIHGLGSQPSLPVPKSLFDRLKR